MPVLPAVASTTSPPGRSSPRFSASRIIHLPALSFTDWPGFMNSALPRMVQPVSSEARFSLIRGVRPTAAATPLAKDNADLTASAHSALRNSRSVGPAFAWLHQGRSAMRMSRFGLVTAALAVTVSAPAYAADLYGGSIKDTPVVVTDAVTGVNVGNTWLVEGGVGCGQGPRGVRGEFMVGYHGKRDIDGTPGPWNPATVPPTADPLH